MAQEHESAAPVHAPVAEPAASALGGGLGTGTANGRAGSLVVDRIAGPASAAAGAGDAYGNDQGTVSSIVAAATPTTVADLRQLAHEPPRPGRSALGIIDVNDVTCEPSDPESTRSTLFCEDGSTQPLVAGTEVHSVGVHRRCPDLLYVHGPGMRGYVNQWSVNFDVPIAGATLHTVTADDELRKLASRMFGSHVQDGIDLRFYENVLLYVNGRHPPHNTQGPGIDGLYNNTANLSPFEVAAMNQRGGLATDDTSLYGTFGFRDDGINLHQGRRLWLVSPEYALSLFERPVPSGSYTGGAAAWARSHAQMADDIASSLSPERLLRNFGAAIASQLEGLADVAQEIYQWARDHIELIIAAGMVAIAGTIVTGGGILLVIPPLLALIEVAGEVLTAAAVVQYGEMWIDTASAANGDMGQVELASQHFDEMLINLIAPFLGSALRAGYRGAKGAIGAKGAPRGAGVPEPATTPATEPAPAPEGAAGIEDVYTAARAKNVAFREEVVFGQRMQVIEPVRNASPLNRFAESCQRNLGVRVVYGEIGGAEAAFIAARDGEPATIVVSEKAMREGKPGSAEAHEARHAKNASSGAGTTASELEAVAVADEGKSLPGVNPFGGYGGLQSADELLTWAQDTRRAFGDLQRATTEGNAEAATAARNTAMRAGYQAEDMGRGLKAIYSKVGETVRNTPDSVTLTAEARGANQVIVAEVRCEGMTVAIVLAREDAAMLSADLVANRTAILELVVSRCDSLVSIGTEAQKAFARIARTIDRGAETAAELEEVSARLSQILARLMAKANVPRMAPAD